MSLHKEIEQEAAKIGAHLAFKYRVHAYYDRRENKIVVRDDVITTDKNLQAMGTYTKLMNQADCKKRLYGHIVRLSKQGHIPSSLGKWAHQWQGHETPPVG